MHSGHGANKMDLGTKASPGRTMCTCRTPQVLHSIQEHLRGIWMHLDAFLPFPAGEDPLQGVQCPCCSPGRWLAICSLALQFSPSKHVSRGCSGALPSVTQFTLENQIPLLFPTQRLLQRILAALGDGAEALELWIKGWDFLSSHVPAVKGGGT